MSSPSLAALIKELMPHREYCLRCFAAAKVAYATRYPEASLEPSTDDKAIANVENLDSDAQDHLLACQRPAGMRHDLATPLFNYSKYTKEDFHSPALFAPLSRRSAAHLEQIVKELEAVDTSPREAVACLSSPVTEYDAVTYLDPTEETSLPIAYIDNADLSDEIFNRLWRTGEPFVARGVVSKEGVWTPEYIIKSFGDDLCQVEVRLVFHFWAIFAVTHVT